MRDDKIENFIKSGKITAKVLEYAKSLVGRGSKNVYEICEKIERRIVELGGVPAFPCNIGINEIAAHYSPYPTDESYLPDEGIVKIDVGVRIDGCITDAAISIPLSSEYREIVEYANKALMTAIKHVKPGVKTGEIGYIIEKVAKEGNFKTIRNLSGHLIEEFNLHAGKSIPNVKTVLSDKIIEGEIYAIEPFLTFSDAAGLVKPIGEVRIYSLIRFKKPKKKELEGLYREIVRRFKTLPFSPRWLLDVDNFGRILELINYLKKEKILDAYPVLIEEKRGYVAQFEHTILVKEGEALILTES